MALLVWPVSGGPAPGGRRSARRTRRASAGPAARQARRVPTGPARSEGRTAQRAMRMSAMPATREAREAATGPAPSDQRAARRVGRWATGSAAGEGRSVATGPATQGVTRGPAGRAPSAGRGGGLVVRRVPLGMSTGSGVRPTEGPRAIAGGAARRSPLRGRARAGGRGAGRLGSRAPVAWVPRPPGDRFRPRPGHLAPRRRRRRSVPCRRRSACPAPDRAAPSAGPSPCASRRRSGRPGNRARRWVPCPRWSRRTAVPTSRPRNGRVFPPAGSCP